MRRVAWSALLIVLMLGASPRDAFAQSSACHVIRHGESASQAARRVTGRAQNAYQPWFQIMNPSSRFVPKSQYDRIRAGWRACVIRPAIRSVSSNANHLEEPGDDAAAGVPNGSVVPAALASADAGGRPRSAADILRRLGNISLTVLWLGAAMAVLWFGSRIVDDYLGRRKTASIVVRHFVQRFVEEFERPLVRNDVGDRPVRSRLRFGLRRGRFDILLAPGAGRRYPNLSDHKKNVEYDVSRVMHVIGDDSFLSGAPYTRAGWTVVPFQFAADPEPSGVTCISSL
jgi:hypothetical protein